LESNIAGSVSSSDVGSRPKSRNKLFIAVAVLLGAGLVVGVLLVSALQPSPAAEEGCLFVGAYADYEGETSVMGFSFSFRMNLEVLDFNDTHAYMSTSFKMESSTGETVENETSTWVELSSFSFMDAFSENNLKASYDATVDFGSLGARSCTVYEYATDGPTMTIYVDKEIGWPLKMKATMTGEGSISLDLYINLVDTNIPALE